jgi:AcrR family transcriptional regulator
MSAAAKVGCMSYSCHVMMGTQLTLRERTRRAVQKEIADAALALFASRGYDATTIDDIATAVGMSQRSVFRYFATKEEIVVGKLDLSADDMLAILRARPAGEPAWTSLRRLFDIVGTPDQQEAVKPMHRVIFETPALLGLYLQKLHSVQDAVVAALLDRAEAAGTPYAPDDPAPQALTAAAFGCLVAAQHAWMASPGNEYLASYIDRAMAAINPDTAGEYCERS